MDKSQFESVEEYVRATSLGKLESLPKPELSNVIQVTCDTVVVRDGAILEKPASFEEAFEMIFGMIGKRVKVVSVVYLRNSAKMVWFEETSEVLMRSKEEISEEDISGYLDDVNYK